MKVPIVSQMFISAGLYAEEGLNPRGKFATPSAVRRFHQ